MALQSKRAGQVIVRRDAPRDTWLTARLQGIGGSEIASLFYDPETWPPDEREPHQDRYQLWLGKTRQTPIDSGGNRDTRRGQIFEAETLRLWRDDFAPDSKVSRSGLWQSRRDPLALVTPDLICHGCDYGKFGIVDAKTQRSTAEWGTAWEPNIPTIFQFSGIWGMYVLGADHQHFAVLDAFYDIFERIIYPHDDLAEEWLVAAHTFWDEHVKTGVPPEATRKSAEVLARRWPSPPYDRDRKQGRIYQLSEPEAMLLLRAAAAQRLENRYRQRGDDLLAQLKARVGDATELHWPPDWIGVRNPAATWRPSTVIDGADAKWRAANPELSAAYETVTEIRTLDLGRMVAEQGRLPDGLNYRRPFSMARLVKKGPTA